MKVMFYHTPYERPDKASYGHGIIALAEGLRELGVEYYANIDYWKDFGKNGELLFKKAPAGYKAEVAIYSNSFFETHLHEMEQILDPSQYNVLTDLSGFTWLKHWGKSKRGYELVKALENPLFSKFDLILRNHGVSHFPKMPNVENWAYGLTNRIMETIDQYRHEQTKVQVASNFRILHDLRKEAITRMEPVLKSRFAIANLITDKKADVSEQEQYYWEHSGKRHSEAYFQFLNQSLLAYTFGGLIDVLPAGDGLGDQISRQYHRIARRLLRNQPTAMKNHVYIFQHDSWRFWEVMYSNSCPIHMDFESSGLLLPEYPVNGKHYIGVKNWDFVTCAQQVASMSDAEIAAIGRAGTQWIKQHYAPLPTAQRFLNLLAQRKVV